jgi:iron complex outermembrane receptor protein
MKVCLLIATCAASLYAQQPAPAERNDSIVVTGTVEPVALAETDRDLALLPLPEKEMPLWNSWFSLLQLDPALDLQQRAAGGFQADLSIRGASFGQTLVLLNGMRVNDVQTGHFNLDLPVPLDIITSIEALKGSGSTFYGSDAIGGVVNVRTQPLDTSELRLLGGAGNFGFNQQHAVAAIARQHWSEEIAFARDFSTGFIPDRDYRNLAFSSLSVLKTRLGATSLLLAYSDRPYGADQFYGPYPAWERIKTWFLAAHQDLGENTQADFAFRRHTDLFVLFRDDPAIYTNRHLDDSWQGDLRRRDKLPFHGLLSYGVEGLAESINSNNLGVHSRERASGYVFYELHSARRYSLSAGIREEVYGAHQVATSPSLSGAAWVTGRIKLRAAASRAFRLPSYTELYYSDPADLGNPNLKPETATSYEGGADAYLKTNIHASVTVFQRRDSNVIDYVRADPNAIWQATNFDKLHFTGVEASLVWDTIAGQHLGVSFSALRGVNGSDQQILESKYTFNYPVHSAVIAWNGQIWKGVIARTRLGVLDRLNQSPYALWDVSAGYSAGRIRPFLQLSNLSNTSYQEIVGVVMPGRTVVGGAEFYLFGGNR